MEKQKAVKHKMKWEWKYEMENKKFEKICI